MSTNDFSKQIKIFETLHCSTANVINDIDQKIESLTNSIQLLQNEISLLKSENDKYKHQFDQHHTAIDTLYRNMHIINKNISNGEITIKGNIKEKITFQHIYFIVNGYNVRKIIFQDCFMNVEDLIKYLREITMIDVNIVEINRCKFDGNINNLFFYHQIMKQVKKHYKIIIDDVEL